MTRRQYKQCGMHYSVMEDGQITRFALIRAHVIACLDLSGRFRRSGDKEMARIFPGMAKREDVAI